MRVLHLMARMAPGGTEMQLVGMLKAAHSRRYWEATLCVLSPSWPLASEVEASGIPVVVLDGRNRMDPRRAMAFRQICGDADVVHSSLPGANVFARLTNLGANRPAVIVSERGVEDNRQLARQLADRVLRGRTDAYIGNSADVTGFIRSAHGIGQRDPRIFQIGNGLDTDVFYPGVADPKEGPLRVVAAGRLVPSKRIDLAISILRRLSPSAGIELVVVGDGPERKRLEQAAEGLPVKFLGHVSERQTLADILRSANVFLMTSATEGLPNALLEALACGVPVVASDAPGIRSAVGPGVVLVKGSEDEWCRQVLAAAATKKDGRSLLGDRALSFDRVALEHLKVFEWAAKKSQARHRTGRHQGRRPSSQEVMWPIQTTSADD